ncbi:YopX family protein [Cytobacillus solani]|nr:YopX family protein [Cytobacillus solani]USK57175.1 YopX family protein [Cytobacillus solani]
MNVREIKFRGKPIEDYGDIKWFVGSLILSYEDELAYIEADGQGTVPVEWESVGQYTCLKDKNGKEIYEGDICRVNYKREQHYLGGYYHEEKTGVIEYKFGMFDLYHPGVCLAIVAQEYMTDIEVEWEVIGNIYENPELINS